MRGPSNNGSICSSVCCQGASRTRSRPGRPARGGGQAGAGAESRHTPSWTGPRLQSSPRLESCFRATCPQSRLEARAVWVQRIPGQGTEQLRVKTCSVEVGCGLGTGGGSPSPLRWCGTGGGQSPETGCGPSELSGFTGTLCPARRQQRRCSWRPPCSCSVSPYRGWRDSAVGFRAC